MANIERYGGGMYTRDARALDRSLSALCVDSVSGLAVIGSAGEKHDEILAINTELTRHALVDTVQVAQLEAAGAQLVPLATGRLQFLADQHAIRASSILDRAHRDLGRLA